MVRIIAYACLGISAALAAVYGYTTGNTEAMGVLRALDWRVDLKGTRELRLTIESGEHQWTPFTPGALMLEPGLRRSAAM